MNENYMKEVTIKNYPYLTTVLSGDRFKLRENFNCHIDTIIKNLLLYFDEETEAVALSKIWCDMTKDLMDWRGKKGGDVIMANSAYQATQRAIRKVDPFNEHYPLSQGKFNEIQKDIVYTFLPRRISGPTFYDETLYKENREKICKRHNIGFFRYYKEKILADREVKRVMKKAEKKKLEYTA